MHRKPLTTTMAASLLLAPLLLNGESVTGPTRRDIRGGVPTTHSDYPFAVFVQFWPGACTGSLIAPEWVLTAAHCITEPDINSMEVIWGWPGDATYRRVNALHVHPYYDGTEAGRQYDFALLRLESAITGRSRIVRLADSQLSSYAAPGSSLRAVGYAGNNGYLKYADTRLAECPEGIPDEGYLCVPRRVSPLGEPGDSGGPLLLRASVATPTAEEHPSYVQMGVASAVVTQGDIGWTRYAPVGPSLDWIRSVVTESPSSLPPPTVTETCLVPPDGDSDPVTPGEGTPPNEQRAVPGICIPLGDRGYGVLIEYDTVPGTAGLLSAWWLGEKRLLLDFYVKDRSGVIWEVDERTTRSGSSWVAQPRHGDDLWDSVAREMYRDCDDTSEWACRVDLSADSRLACPVAPEAAGPYTAPDTSVTPGWAVTERCIPLGATGQGVRMEKEPDDGWQIGQDRLLAGFLGFYVRDAQGMHWYLYTVTLGSEEVWRSDREGACANGGDGRYCLRGLFRRNFDEWRAKDDGWIRAVDLQRNAEHSCAPE